MNSLSSARAPSLTIRQMICLFALALTPRLLLLFLGPWQHPGRAFQADSYRYLLLAEALRRHHSFGLPEPKGLMHQSIARLRAENGTLPPADADGLRPESFRTPGYPAFIAAIESLGGSVRAVLAIQCLMGAAMACLAAFISLLQNGTSDETAVALFVGSVEYFNRP